MLKIKIVSVGKIKEKSLKSLIDEYVKRLGRYAKTEMVELSDLPVPDTPSLGEITAVIEKEGAEIIKHISPRAMVVPMCIEGEKYTSKKFARIIESAANTYPEIVFVIGSSHGLCDKVKQMGHIKMSMSDMTFPHNLAKLMLIEQIYRAFKINNNENYHK